MVSETNRCVLLNVVLDSVVDSSCAASLTLCISCCQNSTQRESATVVSGELLSQVGGLSFISLQLVYLFMSLRGWIIAARQPAGLDRLSGRPGIPLPSNDLALGPPFTGSQIKPDGLVTQRSLYSAIYCGTGWTLKGLRSWRGKMNWTHEM